MAASGCVQSHQGDGEIASGLVRVTHGVVAEAEIDPSFTVLQPPVRMASRPRRLAAAARAADAIIMDHV